MPIDVDVLCLGHACYDLIFAIDHHLAADEKMTAQSFMGCGGGLAANAAVAVARLGYRAAYAGYLGNDVYGDLHYREFVAEGVRTDWIVRGADPLSLSVVLVKPDGRRALVSYRGSTRNLAEGSLDLTTCRPQVVLVDGYQRQVAVPYARQAKAARIPLVLDADSLHEGSHQLWPLVDYVIASEKFAAQFGGGAAHDEVLAQLAAQVPVAIITLGEQGLMWRRGGEQGCFSAFAVTAVDTTGAGDAFHGAFAAGLAAGLGWNELLAYASAVGALCTTVKGARLGLPTAAQVAAFLAER